MTCAVEGDLSARSVGCWCFVVERVPKYIDFSFVLGMRHPAHTTNKYNQLTTLTQRITRTSNCFNPSLPRYIYANHPTIHAAATLRYALMALISCACMRATAVALPNLNTARSYVISPFTSPSTSVHCVYTAALNRPWYESSCRSSPVYAANSCAGVCKTA